MKKVIKKAPCRICGKWFTPNPRLGKRQKTCGGSECKKKWHTKKCAEWNKKNPEYFKANYLSKKITAAQKSKDENNSPLEKPLTSLGLPQRYVQEVIGVQLLVIIEYFGGLLAKHVQEVIRV